MGAEGAAEFDEFYRGTAHRVVHLVYATTGDLSLAQDCTQEAYARAWTQWRSVSAMRDPLAWVRTVARRLAVSQWRRHRARERAHARHGVAPPAAAPTPDRVAVLEALGRLSQPVREALALYYLADLSVEQVADETGSPVGTVKARLRRGRHQLAAVLADEHPLPTAQEVDRG
ncbi:sigma-70 family RNA polymerase sigma factor [Phycicoccus sp. MAQZ13P-2]|uniref:RNA polymerase sigma factor n=1 Tax=Phycicoccus mangrovi TaxID=2840470 RepID=UPI001C001B4E|nr:sigma-70 family RNA polymerase sigma factor [Phycicoccus mangrovi]MBT9257666.1 sigma-70 family RNA polymerase sigma factor [Phycicoccus mangrovi]MBT9276106.1 sigma-70 family RNA polymerase sigma factor [Phycicoccus mangrovi]